MTSFQSHKINKNHLAHSSWNSWSTCMVYCHIYCWFTALFSGWIIFKTLGASCIRVHFDYFPTGASCIIECIMTISQPSGESQCCTLFLLMKACGWIKVLKATVAWDFELLYSMIHLCLPHSTDIWFIFILFDQVTLRTYSKIHGGYYLFWFVIWFSLWGAHTPKVCNLKLGCPDHMSNSDQNSFKNSVIA